MVVRVYIAYIYTLPLAKRKVQNCGRQYFQLIHLPF
jgi:hypothetical protein